jgi:hypothetical protein
MNAPLPVIESGVVMPSIGDDVLFRLNGLKLTSPMLSILSEVLPLHAKIVYVWDPTMVNLVVWDHYGHMHTLTSVRFLPPGEDVPVGQTYCELSVMPSELIEGEAMVVSMTELEERAMLQQWKDLEAERKGGGAAGTQHLADTALGEMVREAMADVPATPAHPTYGQKAVGLSLNPSNQDDVAKAKAEAAVLIDRAHDLRQASTSPEVKRMASLAITAAQEAQMWLVKAQTWKD